ncbi:MAG: hypothetical protein V3T86_09420 [Planctomycetota bacterium]
MKNRMTRLLALGLFLTAGTVYAASGIEVLEKVSDESGTYFHVSSPGHPAGSTVVAVSVANGEEFDCDVAFLDPITGTAWISFPAGASLDRIDVVSPNGDLLASMGLGGELVHD